MIVLTGPNSSELFLLGSTRAHNKKGGSYDDNDHWA
jgi:hypothetical protein